MRNYNTLIGRYPGADGMKTGFICASGFNLVATATRDDKRLIAVVLGAPSSAVRAVKAAQLLERGFSAEPAVVADAVARHGRCAAADRRRAARPARRDVRQATASARPPRTRTTAAGRRHRRPIRPMRCSSRACGRQPRAPACCRPKPIWASRSPVFTGPPEARAGDSRGAANGIRRRQAGQAGQGQQDRGRQAGSGRRRAAPVATASVGPWTEPRARAAPRREPADRAARRRRPDRPERCRCHGRGRGTSTEKPATPMIRHIVTKDRQARPRGAAGRPSRSPCSPAFSAPARPRCSTGCCAIPALADTAVIINEFGEIGLDHLLVEQVDDDVVLLQSGCLCCTLRGDLVEALEKLLRDLDNGRVAFRRVILETTGLADPAPVLQTAMAHPYLVMRFRLDGVDHRGRRGQRRRDARRARRSGQAGRGRRPHRADQDRPRSTRPSARGAATRCARGLRALNPAAPILDAAAGEATAARLLDCGLYDPDAQDPRRQALARRGGLCGRRARTTTITTTIPTATTSASAPSRSRPTRRSRRATFEMFLDLLRSLHGPKLLRLKGIVKIAETPDTPLVIHGVQHVLHPPARLDALARRRPAHPHRVHRPRPRRRRRSRDLFDAFLGRTRARPAGPRRARRQSAGAVRRRRIADALRRRALVAPTRSRPPAARLA